MKESKKLYQPARRKEKNNQPDPRYIWWGNWTFWRKNNTHTHTHTHTPTHTPHTTHPHTHPTHTPPHPPPTPSPPHTYTHTHTHTHTKRKPHPLVRLKNKIITHLGSWKTNKQTTQTTRRQTTRRQKLDPTPMPLEIKIMMCA